jgi:hypothetical protein
MPGPFTGAFKVLSMFIFRLALLVAQGCWSRC